MRWCHLLNQIVSCSIQKRLLYYLKNSLVKRHIHKFRLDVQRSSISKNRRLHKIGRIWNPIIEYNFLIIKICSHEFHMCDWKIKTQVLSLSKMISRKKCQNYEISEINLKRSGCLGCGGRSNNLGNRIKTNWAKKGAVSTSVIWEKISHTFQKLQL